MEVRSGLTYWRAIRKPIIQCGPLTSSAACDVVILGGGISGALIAHYLRRDGVNTILLDQGEPGTGSTAASTGLLQYAVDELLVDLVGKVGEPAAVQAYRRGLRAIDEIEQLVGEIGDPCGFSRRETLFFASRFWHYRRLKREYDLQRQKGFDVRFVERKELKSMTSIDAAAALVCQGDAQIDPYYFTQLLLSRGQAAGLRVFGNTEVQDISEGSEGVTVKTAGGVVTARTIVSCTQPGTIR